MNSDWKYVPLGKHCEIFSGFPFRSEGFTDHPDDIHLVKGENIGQGEILWDISKRWPRQDVAELDRFKLIPGDVVLAMDRPWVPAGLKYARISESSPEALLVQRVSRLRARNGLEQVFLPYVIGSPEFVSYVQNVGRGVGVPHISGKEIGAFEFKLPSINEQRKIAEVLSCYDNFIENNCRRMALLEQSARLLYEEWFVRLRFPGHEHTRIVDGVPEGWERKKLGQCLTLKYGKALKAEDRVAGDYPVYGSSGIVGSHDKPLVKGPAIILGRKGNVGSVYWSSKSFYPIDTVYFVEAESSSIYLYYALKNMHFISTDVAVPGLNRDFAYSRMLLQPTTAIHRAFLEAVAPVHAQLETLDELNQKLRATRDLLLPRLMSGELVA
jgi:type I restriction enzyme, S subunit